MLAVVRIAVAGGVGIFESEARFRPGVCKSVSGLGHHHISLLIQAFSRSASPSIAKITQLSGRFERVIKIADLTGV